MKRSLIALSILSAGLLAVVAAPMILHAGEGDATRLPRRPWETPRGRFATGRMGRWLVLQSELALTDQQRMEVLNILKTHAGQIAEVARPLVRRLRALREAIRADEVDEKKIRAAAGNLTQAVGDAAVLAARIRAQAAKVLTEDQIERIDDFHTTRDGQVDKVLEKLAQVK